MEQMFLTTPEEVAMPPRLAFGPWFCGPTPPGAIAHPDQLPYAGIDWLPARVPGTVASALHAARRWDYDRPADLDGQDWWYRTTFDGVDVPVCRLCLDGLATHADVWLNGCPLLTSRNMFRAYRIDVTSLLQPQNELVIGFRSLTEALNKKRPRPRWKTNLVSHQQLRWHRTSLLGRIPGWSPPAPAVGPWRKVWLDTEQASLANLNLASRMEEGEGVVCVQARIHSAAPPTRAALLVQNCETAAEICKDADAWLVRARLRVPEPPLWWPHTHGEPTLLECSLRIEAEDGCHFFSCGKIGFRRLFMPLDGDCSLHINDVPIYCRGACWTVSDMLTMTGTEEGIARDLCLARDAGVNMLRVGGTMVYESDTFYRLCDEMGILVWQDFMFANMDYPVEDADFLAEIEAEARYQLSRLAPHPCLAVWCGNSEVEQQAAMLGRPRELWRNDWFATHLPRLCSEYAPDVPYVASTPSGGSLPFHVREGFAHYYGIGAYLRSPQELRRDDVKFTPECLAFANVPEADTVRAILDGASPALHHPCWKQRVPRDTGAGWDFDDVRDYYLHYLFGVDPVRLRCFDMPRYLQLSRVVPGEMMERVFSEWRGGHTNNRGALVWFYKDLWPAPGWGIVDSFGMPKAAYYYLRRCWRPRQITLTDEGLDGLHVHVVNETAEPLQGWVELLLLRDGRVVVARQELPCHLPTRARQTFASDALLGGFHDVTYSYRFGPSQHQLAIATLYDAEHRVLGEAYYFVELREPAFLSAVQLDTKAKAIGEGRYEVEVCCDRFLQSVSLDAQGFLPDDNYFHLVPSRPKRVRFAPRNSPDARFQATLEALNLQRPLEIRM